MDGVRRPKDDIAFEALGAVDEAQVTLGVCRALVGTYLAAARSGGDEKPSGDPAGRAGTGLFRKSRLGTLWFPWAMGQKGRRTSHIPSRTEVIVQLQRLAEDLATIQKDLLIAGGILSSSLGDAVPETMARIDERRLKDLARIFDRWREEVHIEPRFFIAGDSRLGSELDRARTVVRRAERRVVTLVRERGNKEQIPVSRYLNHLSDLCFVVARWADFALPVT